MNKIKISFFIFIYFCINGIASNLDEIPEDIRNQFFNKAKYGNINNKNELSKLIKNTDLTKKDKMKNDTIPLKDSTREVDTKKELDTTSIYEKIIVGDTIYPDSMLKNLQIFGHDIFSKNQELLFSSAENISIPSDYIVNTDDEIIIILWGRINDEYRLKVDRDGYINIPKLGPVPVSNKNFSAVQKDLKLRIENIEGVNASISIGTLRTIGIFIIGEVRSPGFYTIGALSNISNALFAAGGPNKNGSLRNIQLKRNNTLLSTLDLYKFLLDGDDRSNFRLQSGDVIHIPLVQKMVAVSGNIRRPALYELKGNEMLDEVINLAGGITPSGWTNSIQIDRYFENKRQITIDIDTINKISSIRVFDGDIIKVFPIIDKNQNVVFLSGNVCRPGKYEFKSNMKITDIIPDYSSLLPETYLDYAILIRQDPPRFLNRIQTFNLKNALDNPLSEDNIALQERDNIIIYSLDYFEPDRTVEIDGSVTLPGKYKLMENMKIRDLILQAGGLRDDASTTRGELYRRLVDLKTDLISTVKFDFSVEGALTDEKAHNTVLHRLDRVFIRNKLGWEKERKITLKGQFNYPGTYIIFEGENLQELISRAGGFKKDAYLSAAVFTRASVKEFEEKRLEEYSSQLDEEIMKLSAEIATKENPAEAQAILDKQIALKNNLINSKASGRIVIDLTDSTKYSDFSLEDGDDLSVPRNLKTVSVIGEVYNPSTFKFEKTNSSVNYYLEAAGGTKNTSDIKHIYIIKANGNIRTNKNKKILKEPLEPGDAVVVPQNIKYSNPHKLFVDTVDAIFKISSLLGTLVALIIAVNSI